MKFKEITIEIDNKGKYPWYVRITRYGDKYPLILHFANIEDLLCNLNGVLVSQIKENEESEAPRGEEIAFKKIVETSKSKNNDHLFSFDGEIFDVYMDKIDDHARPFVLDEFWNLLQTDKFKEEYNVNKKDRKTVGGVFKVDDNEITYTINLEKKTINLSKMW